MTLLFTSEAEEDHKVLIKLAAESCPLSCNGFMWKNQRSCWALNEKKEFISVCYTVPWVRVDQACQDFHGDQGHPAEQREARKHNQILTEYQSIYSISNFGIKPTKTVLLWMRPEKEKGGWGGYRPSGEFQPSCYSNLFSYTLILSVCHRERWVVRHLGLLMGVEAYGK